MRRQSAAFRRLSRGARQARRAGPGLSELREPRRDRAPGRRARARRRLAARSRRRAALSRRGAVAGSGRAPAAHRAPASPMRCASTWRRRSRAPGALHVDGDRARVRAARPARSRPTPAAWGDVVLARKETPTSYHLVGRGRRRAAGRDPRGARAGSVLVDQRPPAAAGAARPAGADLPPPPPDPRRRAAKSSRNRRARPACASCATAGATPADIRADGRTCLSASRGRRACCRGKLWPGRAMREAKDNRRQSGRRRAKRGAPARRASAPRAARAIEATLADLAHDIRTPLTGILALASCWPPPSSPSASAAGPTRSRARPSISRCSPR